MRSHWKCRSLPTTAHQHRRSRSPSTGADAQFGHSSRTPVRSAVLTGEFRLSDRKPVARYGEMCNDIPPNIRRHVEDPSSAALSGLIQLPRSARIWRVMKGTSPGMGSDDLPETRSAHAPWLRRLPATRRAASAVSTPPETARPAVQRNHNGDRGVIGLRIDTELAQPAGAPGPALPGSPASQPAGSMPTANSMASGCQSIGVAPVNSRIDEAHPGLMGQLFETRRVRCEAAGFVCRSGGCCREG